LLVQAARFGGLVLVTFFLVHFDVNSQGICRGRTSTPLGIALAKRRFEIADYLLGKTGIDVNIAAYGRSAPFHLVSKRGVENLKILHKIMKTEGFDPNYISKNDENSCPLLSFCIRRGFVAGFDLLMSRDNVNVNVEDSHKMRPIHYAVDAAENSLYFLGKLIARNELEVNVKLPEDEQSPLMHCVQCSAKCALLLSRSDLDLHLVGKNGVTALGLADFACAKMLVEKGGVSLINQRIKGFGMTIHQIMNHATDEMVRWLSEIDGLDLITKNAEGLSAWEVLKLRGGQYAKYFSS
jgi:hypothetical protein